MMRAYISSENLTLVDSYAKASLGVTIADKVVGAFILAYFISYEIITFKNQGKDYMKQIWNYLDWIIFILYFTLFAIDILAYYDEYLYFADSTAKILRTLLIFAVFFKYYFFLRIFKGFSFLVSMLLIVFRDLVYFLGLYILIIIQFGVMLSTLQNTNVDPNYSGINNFGYMLDAY